jgi:hypothetical protein
MGTLSLESLRFGLSFILSQIESAEEGDGIARVWENRPASRRKEDHLPLMVPNGVVRERFGDMHAL